jgi:cytochrome c biogenesis protein CcdA
LSSAFAAGCIVTAIETVCTGQIYAPTLAIVIADSGPASREAALLFLYNLMFVVPLLAVLILAWRGTTLPTLLQWSARHTAVAKTVMGLFFLALAVLLLALRTGR